MRAYETDRGFIVIDHETFGETGKLERLIQESSAMDNRIDPEPGSSFLWIGQQHHLSRDEVRELVKRVNHWLQTGRLFTDP